MNAALIYNEPSMGIYDRDYYRGTSKSSVFSSMRAWSANNWLIALNVAVFVLNHLLTRVSGDEFPFRRQPIFEWGVFTISSAIYHVQLWRFLSFQFLHWTIQHLAFNMLALFFFGPLVESILGWRRYVAFYLICGLAGPILFCAFGFLGVLHVTVYDQLAGASAGIFGVLIAAALVAPNITVTYYLIPMTMRHVAWIMVAIAVYVVLSEGNNAGGETAHLGGGAMGWLLIRNPQLLNFAHVKRRSGYMRYRP